jgi:hypothetical protein
MLHLRFVDRAQTYADNATCAVEYGVRFGCERNSKCSTWSTRENPAASAIRSSAGALSAQYAQ